jgi:uncharacterized metal-binding protein
MPRLPDKKVGVVACSGEELAVGTVTRLASLRVLEELRPDETVTICLPLFLAGGEGDRAFARFYPTVAVDGCELRCAARATEMYSGRPAASLVVTELCAEHGLDEPTARRHLDPAGHAAVELTARRLSELVDGLLGQKWSRRAGAPMQKSPSQAEPQQAGCACGAVLPAQTIQVQGTEVTLTALPLIFSQFLEQEGRPGPQAGGRLLDAVKVYNQVPADQEQAFRSALDREYRAFYRSTTGEP